MSKQFGPLDVECDSPPYSIVEACASTGFRSPADVGWRRFAPLARHDPAARHFRMLDWLIGSRRFSTNCVCGRRLSALNEYVFTSIFGERTAYILGQCPACRTILWAPSPATSQPGAQ
jgi:hypothetical protein